MVHFMNNACILIQYAWNNSGREVILPPYKSRWEVWAETKGLQHIRYLRVILACKGGRLLEQYNPLCCLSVMPGYLTQYKHLHLDCGSSCNKSAKPSAASGYFSVAWCGRCWHWGSITSGEWDWPGQQKPYSIGWHQSWSKQHLVKRP